jgi:hypothetical protein
VTVVGWPTKTTLCSGWRRSVPGPELPKRPTEDEGPDLRRIVEIPERHGVDYLVVGGIAADMYGASRRTKDFGCLIRGVTDNLERMASAMRELNARLRAEGLSDEEASALPIKLDGSFLKDKEIAAWRTDAGDFDVMVNLPNRSGKRRTYDDLLPASNDVRAGQLIVRLVSLEDIIESKEWTNREKDRDALPELRDIVSRHNILEAGRTGGRDLSDSTDDLGLSI